MVRLENQLVTVGRLCTAKCIFGTTTLFSPSTKLGTLCSRHQVAWSVRGLISIILARVPCLCHTVLQYCPLVFRKNKSVTAAQVKSVISLPAKEHQKAVIMDRAGVPAGADFVVLSESHPGCLSPTDPEIRGRRRRRDPVPVYTALHRPQHPVESSTLRGRRRCRSLSCMNNDNNFLSLSASRAASPRAVRHHHHHHETTTTALAEDDALKKRRMLSVVLLRPENHRRSQSPSRSRSPVLEKSQKKAQGMLSSSSSIAARRRQRTQSRSRPHGEAGLLDTGVLMEGSSLRLELMTTDGSGGGQR